HWPELLKREDLPSPKYGNCHRCHRLLGLPSRCEILAALRPIQVLETSRCCPVLVGSAHCRWKEGLLVRWVPGFGLKGSSMRKMEHRILVLR
ncbi:hypothetical protein ACLOJK_004300, partial [Asimina triloba]